jgi:hypothetical protein
MMTFIVIFLALLLVIGFFKYMNQPIRHRITNINELRVYLNGFIAQCSDGSILFVKHQKTGRFLQFALYLEKRGGFNLHFGFPDAPWSRDFFNDLASKLSAENIEYNIRAMADEKVRRFLTVDDIRSIDEGVRIAKLALKAMKLPENDIYQVHMEGWLRSDLLKKPAC